MTERATNGSRVELNVATFNSRPRWIPGEIVASYPSILEPGTRRYDVRTCDGRLFRHVHYIGIRMIVREES
jgi:hypothetical protein